MNIKKPRVHELAQEAAARTGQSQTSVVEAALEQYLGRLGPPTDGDDARRRRVDAILRDVDTRMTDQARAALTTQHLYDDDGMPA